MPRYSDGDDAAFSQLSQFGPAGKESADLPPRGSEASRHANMGYLQQDLEQFNRLMDFGGKRAPQTVQPQVREVQQSAYSAGDLAAFERLALPASHGWHGAVPDIKHDATASSDAGQYTAKDQQAFDALMRLEPGMEITEPKPATPRALATNWRPAAAPSVPVRASIKIVDADAERARERENSQGGLRRIKIVFSDAGGPGRRD